MTVEDPPLAAPPTDAHDAFVVELDHDDAIDPAIVGGKAAALARARRAGFEVLPAAVLTTALSNRYDDVGSMADDQITTALTSALDHVGGADAPMVVRSSSVVEDQADSSKAGQFESVLDVTGLDELRAAAETVLLSRERAEAADEPIAVLVQPMVQPSVAGVLFGIDPVSGRSDRRVVTAVAGTPDRLVSGEVDGSRWTVDPEGKVIDEALSDDVRLDAAQLTALVELCHGLSREFGGPQDIEWGIVDGTLTVLQSRPVTTPVRGVPSGPIYGPGPIAETFPEALDPLEQDLWVPPLRDGVREALKISGAVDPRVLDARDLVIVVDGQVALDLEVTGEVDADPSFAERMAARVRRLRSAWRLGRLRVALPTLAQDLCDRADRDLEQVPPFEELSMRQLIALIERGRQALRSLHAHEILMGTVSDPTSSNFTGASVALRILTEARRDGISDEEIVRRAPVVLALVPPRVTPTIELPEASTAADLPREAPEAAAVQVSREALRMRVRWMQELLAQAAWEVGVRLVERGELEDPAEVRLLRFDDVAAVASWQTTVDPSALDPSLPTEPSVAHDADGTRRPATLPAQFQLSDRSMAVPVDQPGESGGGTGAGGGTATGVVTHDVDDPPPGSVLIVGSLTPQLGPKLPGLAAIVAETGSVLSHLAILARESGVATVVGHTNARQELPEGTKVSVDGGSGRVTTEGEPASESKEVAA